MTFVHEQHCFPNANDSTIGMTYPFRAPLVYFQDFMEWTTLNQTAVNSTGYWRSGGAGTPTYTPADDAPGGEVILTTTNTSADEAALQLTGASFLCAAATSTQPVRQTVFAIRYKASSITTASQFAGLWVKDQVTSAPLSPLTGTQPIGIGFVIVNGVYQYISKPHSGSAVTATTLAGLPAYTAATYVTLTMKMDANNVFSFWVNGTRSTTLVSGASTPLSSTVGLSPAFGIKTNTTAAITMNVDWVYTATEAGVNGR